MPNAMHIAQVDVLQRVTRDRHTPIATVQRLVSGGLLCLAAVACGSDSTGPAPRDLSSAFWTLSFNYHAINMALQTPYNTVQSVATPLTIAGNVVSDTTHVQYSTHDSTVTVDSLGNIRARYATLGQSATVVASMTAQGVTLVDTAYVQVDSFPLAHPLATFSIHSAASNRCRKSAYDAPFNLPVYAVDAVGDTLRSADISKLEVYYTSSDQTVATIDHRYGYVRSIGPSSMVFTANALVDGVVKQDTLSYVLGPHHQVTITADIQEGTEGVPTTMTFSPSTATVGAGWTIDFVNPTLDPVDIIFTDPMYASSWNFSGYISDGHVIPTDITKYIFHSGAYTFQSNLFGQSGSIIVQCDL